MVDLVEALNLRRLVWKVLVDAEREKEAGALVHSLVRFDLQLEVEDIVGVFEDGLHGGAERQLGKVCEFTLVRYIPQ